MIFQVGQLKLKVIELLVVVCAHSPLGFIGLGEVVTAVVRGGRRGSLPPAQ
jgi:hypothetical protein